MNWNQLYGLRSYLKSSLWIVPFIAIPLNLVATRMLHRLDAWLGWSSSGLHRARRTGVAPGHRHVDAFFRGLHIRFPARGDSSRQRANDAANYRYDVVTKRRRQIHRRPLHIYLDVRAECAKQDGEGCPPAGYALSRVAWDPFLRGVLLSDRLRIAIITPYQYLGTA